MRIFSSADETGNIKEVLCSRGTDTSKKDGQHPELVQSILNKDEHTNVRNRIVDFAVFQEKWLVAARLGGIVSVYEYYGGSSTPEDNYKLLHTYKVTVDAEDKPVALVTFDDHGFIMVAYESSRLFAIDFDEGQFGIDPLLLDLPPRQTKKPITLSAFVSNPYVPGVFAYGGKNNDLQVIKLFDKTKIFTSKDFHSAKSWKSRILFQAENVEPDHLDLQVPIWITNILFLKDSPKKGYRIITSTKYGHIRIYDTSKDEQPIDSFKVCDKAILSLVFATEAQDEIIISDTHTFVARLSLTAIDKKAHRVVSASAGTFYKPSLKLLGKYSEGGNTGAIHGIDISYSSGLVAFGGLDRYLRVFEIESRKLVMKVYLGTQISAVRMIEETEGDVLSDKLEEKRVDDEEEFWKELEEGKQPDTEIPAIKRRKRNV